MCMARHDQCFTYIRDFCIDISKERKNLNENRMRGEAPFDILCAKYLCWDLLNFCVSLSNVWVINERFSFRAATIQADSDGQLWAMDRQTFRRIILKSAFKKRKMYEQFLNTVPMLSTLQVSLHHFFFFFDWTEWNLNRNLFRYFCCFNARQEEESLFF